MSAIICIGTMINPAPITKELQESRLHYALMCGCAQTCWCRDASSLDAGLLFLAGGCQIRLEQAANLA